MREQIKGKLLKSFDGRKWTFIFNQPIHVEKDDELIFESYYGFGDTVQVYIERKEEVKDD